MISIRLLLKKLSLLGLGLGLNACSMQVVADAMGNLTMTPSVTYLRLLQHTPFFTSLNTKQLGWMIDHPMEWKVVTAGIIATNESEPDY
ncbi:hypothetical protein L3V77_09035 [Vibrio sp. DW001]|uniref:hypothetical protein n=1 Tax=Vibrio sp. DW001 TaxID=2912315 RepID=UPI0023AE9EEF|nr:hypothetical protein [Vibrio sp. DW001]WED25223.1 hypothetical protein L3V77_09035 [Vibrio sp. DW001]